MAQTSTTLPYRTIPRSRSTLGGRFLLWLLTWLMGLALFVGIALWQYNNTYDGRVLPGVSVNGVPLDGLTPDQAEALLRERLRVDDNSALVVTAADQGDP